MDKHEARFILSSFRPDGSDLDDPAFAEALSLAARDVELGSWLANERATDTAFAAALAEVSIPENLREELFSVLTRHEELGFDEVDAAFAVSLATLRPPAGLRAEILDAMAIERKVTALPAPAKSRRMPAWPAIGLAAAAGIALAFVLNTRPDTSGRSVVQKSGDETSQIDPSISLVSAPLSHRDVQIGAIDFLSSDFQLDRTDPQQENLFQYLASNKLPIPDDLPPGLKNAKGIGCRELPIKDHTASLICFQQEEGSPVVHLVVFKRGEVAGESCKMKKAKSNCRQCKVTGWSMASWESEENSYFILSKAEPQQLAAFF